MASKEESKYWIFICWLLIGIGIGLVIVSIINFQNQISISYLIPVDLYDEELIPALEQISHILPQNETIVVSSLDPLVMYFTKHNVDVPWSAYSEKSLLRYMRENNYTYLLVFEGGDTRVEALDSLFTQGGLKKLNIDFKEIANFPTKYSNLHLYQRIV